MYAFKRNYYLKHHGIQGQKWGVKNGPPYPLDSSKSTGKRLKTDKGTVRTGQPKKTSLKDKILNKIQPKKEEKPKEEPKVKNLDEDGYEKDEYGWLNKDVNVEDSSGRKVNLHTMIDTDFYDRDTKSYRQRTDSEMKETKSVLENISKDFKEYDKIARDFIKEDMKDYLPGWGDGNIAPESFMKRLKDPAIRVTDDLLTAVIEYTSPDTWHWHSVEIDIKKKKATSASMDG